MIAGLQKRAQDYVALGRLLQPHTLQMAVENFLRLAHHLARKCGLIVDALLKHGAAIQNTTGILKMKFIFNLARAPLAYNQGFFMSTIL
jgi:hypothetical protein